MSERESNLNERGDTERVTIRRRVRTRIVGALLLIEPDDGSIAGTPLPRSAGPTLPRSVTVDIGVALTALGATSDREIPIRLVLVRSDLEYVARLRDVRDAPRQSTGAGAPASMIAHVPRLLRVGTVSIVRLVDVARASGIATNGSPPPAVARARSLLHQRLNETIRVEEIAEMVGMHRVHLSREFRRWFGVPPMRYVYDLRLERAVEMLATTTHSLARIAVETGFADHGHLTRRFAVRLGIVPSALRERMRAPVEE